MNQSITKRVSRIISGSFNALVNKIETTLPDVVMEEAIREIELVLDEVRAKLGKVIAAKHLSNKHLAEKKETLATSSQKIGFAISAKRDDLAKAAISHQLDIEAQMPILEQAINHSAEQEKELEGYLSALLAKKREMRDQLALLKKDQSNLPSKNTEKTAIEKKVDQAATVFERVLQNQRSLPDSIKPAPYLAELVELERLAHNNRIEERLKKFKALQNVVTEDA